MKGVDRQVLRQMVCEVLEEEIGHLRQDTGAHARTTPTPQVREEAVTLRSNADLMSFVHRLLGIARDGHARQEIESGRWLFRLANGGPATGMAHATSPHTGTVGRAAAGGKSVCIERGLVSERQIDAVPVDCSELVLGKHVRLTPLARDRARQRGIRIKRVN